MAEYAHAYGGAPPPDSPWPLFLALAERSFRFTSRRRLELLDSTTAAIGASLGGDPSSGGERDRLFRLAYPVKRTGVRMALIQSRPKNGASPETEPPHGE